MNIKTTNSHLLLTAHLNAAEYELTTERLLSGDPIPPDVAVQLRARLIAAALNITNLARFVATMHEAAHE
jgi:hypothetical protein